MEKRNNEEHKIGNVNIFIFPTNAIEWTAFIVSEDAHHILWSGHSFDRGSLKDKAMEVAKKWKTN